MKKINYFILILLSINLYSCGVGSNTTQNTDNKKSEAVQPKAGATSIGLIPIIQIKFDESVSNVNASTIILTNTKNHKNVAVSNIIGSDNNIYTFNPKESLGSATTYKIIVTSEVIDNATGKPLPENSFSFTTTPTDLVHPEAVEIEPNNGQGNVSKAPNITIKFSEAVKDVNLTTVKLHAGSATGKEVAIGNIKLGYDNLYTFSPSSPLSNNTKYFVVLDTGITDSSGNHLTQTAFSFTTGDFRWGAIGTTGFSSGVTGSADYQSLAISSTGGLYVAFSDSGKDDKTTVMKYSDNWKIVGKAGFSAGLAVDQSLAIDSAGTPYVAYHDDVNGEKTTVMKYNSEINKWLPVGIEGFSAGGATYQSLAIDSTNTPYVAYKDGAYGARTTVMKFDGTNWVYVGKAGFSAGGATYQSLAIDSTNTPYVAYKDGAYGARTTVMKFDGTNWVYVGKAGFSAGSANFQRLAIDSKDTPYVAYTDSAYGGKSSVMKFDGTNWVDVGKAGFSAGDTNSQSLAIDSNDTIYAAYRDNVNGGKTTVMKFDGESWGALGKTGISLGGAYDQSLKIDPTTNTPVVAYGDIVAYYRTTVMMWGK